MGRKRLLLGYTLILTALVWASGLFIPSYNVESTILFESEFPGDAADWQAELPELISITSTAVAIRAYASSRHKLTYVCPELGEQTHKTFRITADISLLEQGVTNASSSVLGFWFVDNEGVIVRYHNVGIMPGRYEQIAAAKTVEWPEGATGCVFGLIANAGGPSISITSGRVETVIPNLAYQIAILFIALLFLLYACFLIYLALQKLTFRQLILPVMLMALLVLGVTMTGPLLVKYIHPLFFGVLSILGIGVADVTGNRTAFDWVFKFGHVLVFMLLALCFFAVQRRIRAAQTWILSMLLLIAIASEGLQLHVPDRGASTIDVLINCVGIALAWGGVLLFRTTRNIRQNI